MHYHFMSESCLKATHLWNLYTYPCQPKMLFCFFVKNFKKELVVHKSDILSKIVLIPHKNGFGCIPLCHTTQ